MKQLQILIGVLGTLGAVGGLLFLFPFPTKSLSAPKISQAEKPSFAKWHYWDSTRHIADYDLACRELLERQAELSKSYYEAEESERVAIKKQAKEAIFEGVTQKILPFWNETEWDYDGTTHLPTQGGIACGYFVATVLQHAGIDMDRRKMGQASSTAFIKTLCDTTSIQTFRNKDYKSLFEYLTKKAPDGLYIVGMDKHAGMIAKQKSKVTFIHSRKPRLAGVIFEDAVKSPTLRASKIHVVGNVLANDALVRRWLGETLTKEKH